MKELKKWSGTKKEALFYQPMIAILKNPQSGHISAL